MRILFLHGWQSVVGGRKPSFLISAGHQVANPALNHDDFSRAIETAQDAYEQFKPSVIVGSSRGGAIAMNLNVTDTPLVLLCPAWKRWGRATTIRESTRVLHSTDDDVIPYADSVELIGLSQLDSTHLIPVGSDHRLADPVSLKIMLDLCEQTTR